MANHRLLRDLVPMLGWLRDYQAAWLRRDLVAGVTVWAVMVPTALAYTGIAGVHPVVGLYTVPLALLAYAVFGTSRALVVGPDSATALLSAHTIGALVSQGSAGYLPLTSALALAVGVVFLALGLLRMGWVANFISQPVMKGFIQGLALVTMMTQLPKLFGVAGVHGEFFERLWALARELPTTSPATLAVGLGSLTLLYALARYVPRLPAAFTSVVVSIVAVSVFALDEKGVAVVGSVAAGLPSLGLPDVGTADISAILQGAFAIVLLNYTESLGAAKAAAERTGGVINPDQELIGLGAANLGAGLSSGFVVAGSLSQSAVSMGAGGKTQLAAVFHAALIVLTLLVLIPLFENLPYAVLGAIVIKAMVGMLDLRYFLRLRRQSVAESNIALAAFLGVLVAGVLPGVAVGVVLSILALIYRVSFPTSAALGRLGGSDVYRDTRLHAEAETLPGLLVFRFDAAAFFSNADHFAASLEQHMAEAEEPVAAVLVDAESMTFLDATAAEMLGRLHVELRGRGVTLSFARVRDPVRDRMRRAGLEDAVGAERFHDSIQEGWEALEAEIRRRDSRSITQ
jgi:high affinity sulfate transporter 1